MSPAPDGKGRRPNESAERDGAVRVAVADLATLMATLREACPWDHVQTHGSLRRHLLEEAHEVLEVLDRIEGLAADGRSDVDDAATIALFDDLREELGDLLFQVVFHAHLAAEAGRFDLADVAVGVHDKLIARHPQIFESDAPARAPRGDDPDTTDLILGWEQAKVIEKGRRSVMDGMPHSLPALAYASKVVSKAGAIDPSLLDDLVSSGSGQERALGHRLLTIVRDARSAGLDAESALRGAAAELETTARAREAQLEV